MRAVYKTRETTGAEERGEGWKIETGRRVTLPRFRESRSIRAVLVRLVFREKVFVFS